jgi:NAD(P)-dependent dehydrogenase (short-subunit alcohol dehydrogenase family)
MTADELPAAFASLPPAWRAVLPGWTMTPMAEPVLTWDRFREKVLPRMPVGRWGVPDDFGAVAVYLASPASAFHTADTLLLDGGYSAF